MEKSKQNEHVVCKKDKSVDDNVGNGVDNGFDNGVHNGVHNGVDDSDASVTKNFAHLTQAVDCSLTERSRQNKHIVGKKDNGVDD
eukprot:9205376-Ditylum_brightwellii.AAC.1